MRLITNINNEECGDREKPDEHSLRQVTFPARKEPSETVGTASEIIHDLEATII